MKLNIETARDYADTLKYLRDGITKYLKHEGSFSENKTARLMVGVLYAMGATSFTIRQLGKEIDYKAGLRDTELRFIEHYVERQTKYAGVLSDGTEAIGWLPTYWKPFIDNNTLLEYLHGDPCMYLNTEPDDKKSEDSMSLTEVNDSISDNRNGHKMFGIALVSVLAGFAISQLFFK